MEIPSIDFTAVLPDYLSEINRQLEHRSVVQVLKLALNHFRDDIAMTTAFGASGVALIHHLLPLKPDIKIHFLDTGFHFPETLAYAEKMRRLWDLNLEIKTPRNTDATLGERPWAVDPDRCCALHKVEPLLDFIYEQSAWISAIRRDQGPSRQFLDTVEFDRRGTIKISPFINWTNGDVWRYLQENQIPVNPLYRRGYTSIGCAPCTNPVGSSTDERSGRWENSNKLECGIHDHLNWHPEENPSG